MNWTKLKRYYGIKLRVVAVIFGLVGWFLLFVYALGSHFEQQLLGLEELTISSHFAILIRVVLFSMIVLIAKYQNVLLNKLKEHQSIFSVLRKTYKTTVFGCVFWVIVLLI